MLLLESLLLVSNSTMDSDFLEYFVKPAGIGILVLIAMVLSPTIFLNIKKKIANTNMKKQIELFSESDVQMTKSNSVLQVQTKDIKLIKGRCENGKIVYKCAVNIEELKGQNFVENVIGNTIFLTEQEYILCERLIQEYDEIEIIQRKYRCRITNGGLLDLIRSKNFQNLHLDEKNLYFFINDDVEMYSFDIPQITNSHDQLTEEIKKILFETMETEIWKLKY